MVEPSGHCPYLGLKQNQAIRFASPTPEHRCYATGQAQEIPTFEPNYQASYCLSSGHIKCPLYTGLGLPSTPALATSHGESIAAPAAATGWLPWLSRRDRAIYMGLLAMLVVIAVALVLASIVAASQGGLGSVFGNGAPPFGVQTPTNTSISSTSTPEATSSPRATLTPSATASASPSPSATVTATQTLTPTETIPPPTATAVIIYVPYPVTAEPTEIPPPLEPITPPPAEVTETSMPAEPSSTSEVTEPSPTSEVAEPSSTSVIEELPTATYEPPTSPPDPPPPTSTEGPPPEEARTPTK